jgi:hypothetical protein
MSKGTTPRKAPTKEAFYVRIVLPDGATQFLPATEHIGKPMPFSKPRETCAVQVYEDVVVYSLLHVTKKRASTLQGTIIRMPTPMLTRLLRRAKELEFSKDNEIIVEISSLDTTTTTHRFNVEQDNSKVADLVIVGDEVPVKMDPRGIKISIYSKSPKRPKTLALGFIGHVGKPDTEETLTRVVAKVLNAALALPPFQVLFDIEAVKVPHGGGLIPSNNAISSTTIELPVRLYTDTGTVSTESPVELLSQGSVLVEINLAHASTNNTLLYTLIPEKTIEELFPEFEETTKKFINVQLIELVGSELYDIVADIHLGENISLIEDRLRELLTPVFANGVDITPTKYRTSSLLPS